MNSLNEMTLGLIGAGKMATALVTAWVESGTLSADQIAAYDPNSVALHDLTLALGIRPATSNADACAGRDMILVATKPGVVQEALKSIYPIVRPGQLVISIAAGVPLSAIQHALPGGCAVIRVMPSTPCLVKAGASAFCRGAHASSDQAAAAKQLLDAVGLALEVQEKYMDAVTGLSGSGPAYVFIIIEALADGGVRAGLDRSTALQLAAQCVLGSAKMVLETWLHPGELKDMVASPAGTTIAGLGVLESRGVRGAMMDAVHAAAARSAELSRH
jgi:pyrroline-5-carboxylate reductase